MGHLDSCKRDVSGGNWDIGLVLIEENFWYPPRVFWSFMIIVIDMMKLGKKRQFHHADSSTRFPTAEQRNLMLKGLFDTSGIKVILVAKLRDVIGYYAKALPCD